MQAKKLFDPDKLAHYEGTGWKAYYEHDWFKLLGLVLKICQEQFNLPFLRSVQAGYYIARATSIFASPTHDTATVRRFIHNYYKIARRYSNLKFDVDRVTGLELEYWYVHRRLVGKPDKTEFIESLAQLHSALFGISLEQARPSAEWRVLANNTVDGITQKTSTDVQGDWLLLEDYLSRCYRSIDQEVRQARPSGELVG
ncbi:MAG TPA: hypothetical protein VH186_39155 [Chloroflexia bacterium]|nr:hypothetical protein [Chloroflexia bacterium]